MELELVSHLWHLRPLTEILWVDDSHLEPVEQMANEHAISEELGHIKDLRLGPGQLVVRRQDLASHQPVDTLAPVLLRHREEGGDAAPIMSYSSSILLERSSASFFNSITGVVKCVRPCVVWHRERECNFSFLRILVQCSLGWSHFKMPFKQFFSSSMFLSSHTQTAWLFC